MIDMATIPWTELYPGASTKLLARDETRGMQMNLVKIAPGAVLPRHRHLDIEWIYILEGTFEDEDGIYSKGTFKINEKGSTHQPRSKEGCQLLLLWFGRHERVD